MNIVIDKNEWNFIVNREFAEYDDVYFKYNYFDLYAKHYGAVPEAVFWEDKNIKLFWPHLIRNLKTIKQFENFNYYDLVTPYGYGGPLIIKKIKDKKKINASLKNFFKQYKNYALSNKYVCEFLRFHPIFKNWQSLKPIINVEYANDIIVVNLNQSLENIWKKMRKGHKYNIKKSAKEGCEIKITNKPLKKNIDDFIKIYWLAMDKNQAVKKYYFSKKFIQDHFKLLNTILVEVKYKNTIIGSSMFICGNKIIHYHLSGAVNQFKGVYPANLMLWETIKWAKSNNFQILHLGGGRGKNDSLLEFKKGFAGIIKPFKIGTIIFNMNVYRKLCQIKKSDPKSRFPKYRQGLDKQII